MLMEQLIRYLETIYPLSPGLAEELTGRLQTRSFESQEFLLRSGHISRNIYYIEEGLVRCFYMIGDRDISAWFMKEGDVVVSVNSFFRQVPSAESIQALEPTTVQYIRYEELEFLYKAFIPFNVHGRRVLTHYYCLSEERAISMRSMKAKDRYTWLLRKEPHLLQRVPRKFLASYLGVSEFTLCRINNQKVQTFKKIHI